MKNIAKWYLKWLAKAVLLRHKPFIIGITGSVGKTTTKDALAFALHDLTFLRATAKNFNNEIGLPLTVLGITEEPGRSVLRWIFIGLRGIRLFLFGGAYPKVLILEMGVDRPGDMVYLLSIAKPNISIVTGVSSSHLEYFGTLEAIAQEKGYLVENTHPHGKVFLNADNMYSWGMKDRAQGSVVFYGFGKRAYLKAFNDSIELSQGFSGMNLKVEYKESVIPLRLAHIIARHHVEAVLVALGVGDALGYNVIEVSRRLESFSPSVGRFYVIDGKEESILIDDTYNASPVSTRAGILVLKEIKREKTMVILGDMLELGKEEKISHEALASDIIRAKIDRVLLTGKRMKWLYDELLLQGFDKEHLWWEQKREVLLARAQSLVEPKTVVLIKGSQGMRMEQVVEVLMARSEEASRYLCRQGKEWKKRAFIEP